ncbi:hypothetical protein [Roseateles amylovorans]|jgi:hypothetical protein|uniref:Uncharacterized protein n=1 Tax=Roseateles amylovorans TaxID=2978473 RepID=A0ABY6B866_9BURK|nr:hypothetical protein [Roseateles amylovorans]UXH80655.1 hypothetical protein N4261_12580 [Roseateles amylovorans]
MNTSMMVYAGNVADGLGKPLDCSALQQRNLEERKKFVTNSPKRVRTKLDASGNPTGPKPPWEMAAGTGMTYSSAYSTIPGASGVRTFSSNKLSDTYIDKTARGGTAAQRRGLNKAIREDTSSTHAAAKKKAGALCNEYVHPGGGKGAHAECKIFNQLSNMMKSGAKLQGGSVLLNIDWRSNGSGGPQYSGMPCPDCYAMLCNAANQCDIQILICNFMNQPVALHKADCNRQGGYRRLAKMVDGRATNGRMDPPPDIERTALLL